MLAVYLDWQALFALKHYTADNRQKNQQSWSTDVSINADIKAIRPDYIVPPHCTGFEAISAFAREMPEQFTLNTAGTR
jgi:metal-dependent hydrolase (beta-lactamase superfamily II)